MEHKTLVAEARTAFGKGATGRLRKTGKIPAVIYGHKDHLSITVDAKEFSTRFKTISENTIIDIDLDGKEYQVLVKDYQSDILKGSIDHLDFYEIEKGKALKARVPLEFKGNPPGVKEGGIMVQKLEEVEVECLPKDLPATVLVDISALNLGESIHVKDLTVEKAIKILDSEDSTIVVINLPKSAAATAGDEAEENEEEAAEA